jgi:antitoxin (DNA-binding transcriptional repressor) of toxin-antitoxin stability system
MLSFNFAEARSHLFCLVQRALMGEEAVIARGHNPVVPVVLLLNERRPRRPACGGAAQLQTR